MKHFILIIFCLIAVIGRAEDGKNRKQIRFTTNFLEALQKSKETDKPIFFNCYVDWHGACKLMDSLVFTEPELADFIEEHFVPLRLNMIKSEEGKVLAKRYGVNFYAHYLLLDANGEILHRLGAAKAPEFIESLKQGLKWETSLAGMTERYELGDRSPEFLANYAMLLRGQNTRAKYNEVADCYLQHVDSADLFTSRSWAIISSKGKRYGSEWFNFICKHHQKLIEQNGDKVPLFVAGSAFQEFFPYMLMEVPYDERLAAEIEQTLVVMPQIDYCRIMQNMCQIARLRSQKRYTEMLTLWKETVPQIKEDLVAWRLDVSLGKILDFESSDKKLAITYLNERMQNMVEGTKLRDYRATVNKLQNYKGVVFEDGNIEQILAVAKKKNRPVFVDCFTSWCGPCNAMSKNVFPDSKVGDFFNAHFVNIKIDMEKGEGKELAKKWNIKAYPTYLILTPEGEIIYTAMGYFSPDKMIDKMKEGLKNWKK